MLQYFVGTSSWILLIRMTAPFGSAVIAGYTIMLRILLFALLPSWGMAGAAATLVGQNLGAKKPERAEAAVWRAGFYNMILLGVVAIVFDHLRAATGRHLHQRPGSSASRLERPAHHQLRLYFLRLGHGGDPSLQRRGRHRHADADQPVLLLGRPTPASPGGWHFTRALRSNGIFAAIAISQSLIAVIGMLAFRRGKWKLQKV